VQDVAAARVIEIEPAIIGLLDHTVRDETVEIRPLKAQMPRHPLALKQLSALRLLDIQPGPHDWSTSSGSAIAGARLTPSRLCASTTLLHDLTSLHRSDPLLCETDGPTQP
jgi:hypothetical protein